ncbi:D-glycerate dehydrogenase [Bacilli bacterium]|uniref:2-hydroxyacid dehydrogenase n=1 Tax=Oceanobacillus caeni TaxID=405946 RepID=UPI000621AC22|nr:D-glycerate dehydrogenase [Oceanobacillus caeni]KKE79814.1 2-ketogluconate reductase [Bacilli bacterium VT-13-104]PZD89821.1 D-glycerate dehydrogenase [Bacilli bacterium]MBU8792068.1 D-glycerate dehydrogenase [Oceanobacillus caeni]PZD91343.1 D-glycerate dehydrogenase [Bacilli bacterium]PZD92883.1 D-glycerate dehydrogenase [Bacilli bacterium]
MNKPSIYITRKIPRELVNIYENQYNIRMWEKEEEPVPREILVKEIQHANGIISMLSEKIDEELLSKAPHLKVVANLAVGFDNINVDAAKKRGIIITNTPDVLSETTADLGFALLMATARRVIEANNYIKTDQWKNWAPFLLAGTDIHHKTIGIVGMGRIGEAIAKRAKGFEMEILYHNRSRKEEAEKELGASYVSFDELLRLSDYVVSVVPLTDETKRLFNKDTFRKMKPSSIFINISRGGVVDEEALVDALKNKVIEAAGLDVFKNEPINSDHPLLKLNNVVCLPHIGSSSIETRTRMIQLCLENVDGVIQGRGAKTPV